MLILMLIRSFIHDLSGSLSNDEDSKIYPSLSSNQGEGWANHYSKIFLDLLLSIQWLYIMEGIKSKYHLYTSSYLRIQSFYSSRRLYQYTRYNRLIYADYKAENCTTLCTSWTRHRKSSLNTFYFLRSLCRELFLIDQYLVILNCVNYWSLAAVVHLKFRSESTFPVPFCIVPSSMDKTKRCNKVDAIRLYASYRFSLLLLKGKRCVWSTTHKTHPIHLYGVVTILAATLYIQCTVCT